MHKHDDIMPGSHYDAGAMSEASITRKSIFSLVKFYP